MAKKSEKSDKKDNDPSADELKKTESEAKGGPDGDALLGKTPAEEKVDNRKEATMAKALEAPSSDGVSSKPGDMTILPQPTSTVPAMPANIPSASDELETDLDVPSASLQAFKRPGTVKLVASWPSVIDLMMTPRDFTFHMDTKVKIRHFVDNLDFLKARDELAEKLVAMYDGIVQDVKKTHMGVDNRFKVTDPSAMGFNLLALKETNSHRLRGDMYDTLSALTISSVSPTEETMYYVGLPWEHRLIETNIREYKKDLYPLTDIHMILKNMLDTTEYFVAPLPEEVQRVSDHYMVKWPKMDASLLTRFLDDNRVLQGMWVDLSSRTILETMEVSATRESVTMSDLRKMLQLSVNVSNGLNDIVQVIDAQKAVRMFYMILKSKMFNRYYALEVNAAVDTFSWTTVIEFLLIKLMVPGHSLTHRARCRINNYLLVHLFANLESAYTGGGGRGRQNALNRVLRYILPDMKDFDNVDYIALNQNRQGSNLPIEYIPFMMNWADGPNPQTEQFDANPRRRRDGSLLGMSAVNLIGRTDAFKPWGGRIFADWDNMTDQMLHFINLNSKLQQDQFYAGVVRGSERPVTRMMSFFEMKLSHLQMLMFSVNKMLRLLCANALITNGDRDPLIEDGCRIDTIPTGGIMSMFTLLVPRTFHIRPPNLDMLLAGMGAYKTLLTLMEAYYLAKDAMPKQSYYKSEILDAAFAAIQDSSPFMDVMRRVLLGPPEKYYMVIPPRDLITPAVSSRHYTMMLAARDVIDQNPATFGFVPYFYRAPTQKRQAAGAIDAAMHEYYYLPADPVADDIHAQVNLSQLIDRFRDETFNELEEAATDAGKYIRFNIPTTFTLKEGPPTDDAGTAPFSHANGLGTLEKLQIKPLTIFYQWEEDFIAGRINTQNTKRPPFYLSPATSKVLRPERTLLNYPREYHAYRKEVHFVDVDQYVLFVRKSDI